MTKHEATLRHTVVDGTIYVAADDFAALLLDVAQAVENDPEPAGTAELLRAMAAGFVNIRGGRP